MGNATSDGNTEPYRYILLFPLIVCFTPSPSRAIESVLFALCAPVRSGEPSLTPENITKDLDMVEARRAGVTGGDVVRDCAVIE
jgi:hypothetical protein